LQSDIDSNGGGDGDIDNTATADSDQTDEVQDGTETLVILKPGIIVGQNVSDTPTQTVDHAVNNTPSAPDGAIDGTPGADVLIGDVGGFETTVVPGAKYNIIVIADTSTSMQYDALTGDSTITTISRLALLKSSLDNLVKQLDDHHLTGGKINFSLVEFATNIKAVDLNGSAPGPPLVYC